MCFFRLAHAKNKWASTICLAPQNVLEPRKIFHITPMHVFKARLQICVSRRLLYDWWGCHCRRSLRRGCSLRRLLGRGRSRLSWLELQYNWSSSIIQSARTWRKIKQTNLDKTNGCTNVDDSNFLLLSYTLLVVGITCSIRCRRSAKDELVLDLELELALALALELEP